MNEQFGTLKSNRLLSETQLAEDAARRLAPESQRLGVVTMPGQIIWDEPIEGLIPADTGGAEIGLSWIVTHRALGGTTDLLRAISAAPDDYLVFSPRVGLIWDSHLLARVRREITLFEARGIPWLCLLGDGMAVDESRYVAAFFDREPSLVPSRGRRLVIQSAGTLYVLKVSNLRKLGLQRVLPGDVAHFMNTLIVIAYGRGLGSFFSSGLYPCIHEPRGLSYVAVEDQLALLEIATLLDPVDAYQLFPPTVPRSLLLTEWVETLSSSLTERHLFSFVVRTLFRRNHLLRRCLISIDYIRRSLDMPCEIVLASDADSDLTVTTLKELTSEFPDLHFTVADGREGSGFSRVRNLIAGLQISSGSRVCIIDDDDYYMPQAVSAFMQSCAFGTDELVIFDTQVIVERWTFTSAKPHREIVRYDVLFSGQNWPVTLRATNSVPLCGVIHPGAFVREVAQTYAFSFDLSEDFIFHLTCFAHPKRPPVKVVSVVGAHQSHRAGDDNVSNVEDRTQWVVDTGNGLYELLMEGGRNFDVILGNEAHAGEIGVHAKLDLLEAKLASCTEARLTATEALAQLVARTTARR